MMTVGAVRRLRVDSSSGRMGAAGEPPVSFSSDEDDDEFEDAMDTLHQVEHELVFYIRINSSGHHGLGCKSWL